MEEIKERPRAVFAETDYPLLRDALMFYATYANKADNEETKKNIFRLYHRLGRVDK